MQPTILYSGFFILCSGFSTVTIKQIVQKDQTFILQRKQQASQQREGLNRAGTELWNSQALGQRKVAPPVKQEPSIEYPLSGAQGPALSATYLVSVTDLAQFGKTATFVYSFTPLTPLNDVIMIFNVNICVYWLRYFSE